MKFELKSLLALIAFIALLLGLLISHQRTRSVNVEAAGLASELYRKHLLRELEKPYGSLFPPGWSAIVNNHGDIVDLRTASGRSDLLARIEEGKTNFRVRCAGGQIMQQEDLLTAPYPIYSFQSGSPPRMVGSSAFALPSDGHPMKSRGDVGRFEMDAQPSPPAGR